MPLKEHQGQSDESQETSEMLLVLVWFNKHWGSSGRTRGTCPCELQLPRGRESQAKQWSQGNRLHLSYPQETCHNPWNAFHFWEFPLISASLQQLCGPGRPPFWKVGEKGCRAELGGGGGPVFSLAFGSQRVGEWIEGETSPQETQCGACGFSGEDIWISCEG